MGDDKEIDYAAAATYNAEDNPILKEASIEIIDVDPPYEAGLRLKFGERDEEPYHLIGLTIHLPSLLAKLGQEGRGVLYEALESFRKHMKDI